MINEGNKIKLDEYRELIINNNYLLKKLMLYLKM